MTDKKTERRDGLLKGNPAKGLFLFAVPLILGNLFQQFYNMTDSIIVGNFVGEDALAAVGASYALTNVFIMIAIGGGNGASVLTAQYLGAGQYGRMKTSISTSCLTFLALSIFLGGFGFFFSGPILEALDTPENILGQAKLYLSIYFLGMPFLFMYNVLASVFNAMGDSKTPLFLLIFSSLYIENLSAGLAFQKVPSVRKSAVGWAVLSGLLAGAAVFLDSAFVPLLLFPIWASIFVLPADRTQQGVRSVRKAGGKKRAAGIAALVFSAVLGYAAILALQVWISGAGPLEALMDRYGLLAGSFGQLSAETGIFWMIPVICLCILYIFAFFDQQRNVGSVWLLPFLLSTFRCVFAQSGGAECAVALLFWLIMAGMGLHGAFFREVKRKGRREAGVSASVVSASAVPATAVPGENGGIEERISTERRPLPGEPIPNPLPGPKKHERREMDYAFEPGEDRMFFDIDRVEEGDDFDYQ